MEIEFSNPRHEALVNDYDALSKRYNKKKGIDSATDILTTLNVLQAAPCLADVPHAYRPHPLKGSYKGHFAVDVDKVHRIIFKQTIIESWHTSQTKRFTLAEPLLKFSIGKG